MYNSADDTYELILHEYILLWQFYYYEFYHSHGEEEESSRAEQIKLIKPRIPPAKAEGDLLTQLLDPPMVLMIQTELCEKKTLKSWLSDHINDRKRRTVVNFFEQVHLLTSGDENHLCGASLRKVTRFLTGMHAHIGLVSLPQ